jgi:hypothetical protein
MVKKAFRQLLKTMNPSSALDRSVMPRWFRLNMNVVLEGKGEIQTAQRHEERVSRDLGSHTLYLALCILHLHFSVYAKSNRIGKYSIDCAPNSESDLNSHVGYVTPLFRRILSRSEIAPGSRG